MSAKRRANKKGNVGSREKIGIDIFYIKQRYNKKRYIIINQQLISHQRVLDFPYTLLLMYI